MTNKHIGRKLFSKIFDIFLESYYYTHYLCIRKLNKEQLNNKKMKNLTAKTKSLVLTKKGEINKTVKNALSGCRFDGKQNKIYPVTYVGSGNFISKRDNSYYVESILNSQGYKFTKGNDAPRGGENGNFFKVSKTALLFLLSL